VVASSHGGRSSAMHLAAGYCSLEAARVRIGRVFPIGREGEGEERDGPVDGGKTSGHNP
jgi:hypothetical protein